MSSSLWLTSLKIQSRQIRIIIFAAALVVYALVFSLFYENVGEGLAALTIFPVVIGAWFFGLRYGVIAASLLIPLNMGLFALVGAYTPLELIQSNRGLSFLALLVISSVIGSLSALLDRLQEQQAELARVNAELDQFAYIVSHDLKAPLRAITNLSGWLEEDLAEVLTTDTRQQLDLLRSRVRRMENLIDGILQYSRAARTQGEISTVEVGQLLAEIIDLIDPPDTFTLVIGPDMPALVTERVKLEQVFMNLISNAVKYHHRTDGRITISVKTGKQFHTFAVGDDGPGVAAEHQEKIFDIFQTLQSRDKMESTGVGLALVKKLVEGQGGTVRLESAEGEGATFYFTWPKTITKEII